MAEAASWSLLLAGQLWLTGGFCTRCESRFFIAKLTHSAPLSTSQVRLRQGVEFERLAQFDLNIAFDDCKVVVGGWSSQPSNPRSGALG
jgi:hypothetical protein